MQSTCLKRTYSRIEGQETSSRNARLQLARLVRYGVEGRRVYEQKRFEWEDYENIASLKLKAVSEGYHNMRAVCDKLRVYGRYR